MNSPASRLLRLGAAAGILALALSGCTDPGASANDGPNDDGATADALPAANGIIYNASPDQDRIRSTEDAELAAKVPAAIAADGKLTVATTAGSVPLTFHATDNTTVIGSEIDLAQLVADKLGLELDLQVTSWENWPLKTESGDYEVVFSNVGINDERLQKFDFASYRAAYMGFEARKDSDLTVESAEDIAGKTIAVGSGTNQEKILLAWNKELEAAGKEPALLQYYGSDADTILALSSGRLDLNLAPYPSAVYRENTRDDLKVVGKVNAGWPNETLVAATTQRGNELAPVISEAVNSLIQDGDYGEVLARWGLSEEALSESELFTADSK